MSRRGRVAAQRSKDKAREQILSFASQTIQSLAKKSWFATVAIIILMYFFLNHSYDDIVDFLSISRGSISNIIRTIESGGNLFPPLKSTSSNTLRCINYIKEIISESPPMRFIDLKDKLLQKFAMSDRTIYRNIHRAGLVFKLRSKIWNADAPDVMKSRLEGARNMLKYFTDPNYIVCFFDEVSFRSYQLINSLYIGDPGERLYVSSNEGSSKESASSILFTTVKGLVLLDTLIRPRGATKGENWTGAMIQERINRAIPLIWKQYGGKKACAGKKIVIFHDNARPHSNLHNNKQKNVELVSIPRYSPDFNPAEFSFGAAKPVFKKLVSRVFGGRQWEVFCSEHLPGIFKPLNYSKYFNHVKILLALCVQNGGSLAKTMQARRALRASHRPRKVSKYNPRAGVMEWA
jgi:hypothetical protein